MSIGGSLECRIVEQDRHSVSGDVDIAFEDLGALRKRGLEREKRVFRPIAGGPTMPDHDGTVDVEERMRHGPRVSCDAQ